MKNTISIQNRSAQIFGLMIVFILFLSGCNDSNEDIQLDHPLFVLRSAEDTKISFSNELVENVHSAANVLTFQYFFNGAGVGIGDLNNDGLQDVFFTGNQVANKLYLNQGDFEFEDVTKAAGFNKQKKWSNGVTMVDINQDGWLDIYVCNGGPTHQGKERRNQMWINNQDGTFSDKAAVLGIADPRWSTQSVFFDMDGDGDLDLYVMNHSIYWMKPFVLVDRILKDPKKLSESSGQMYQNTGGRFVNVTSKAGLMQYSYGLGVVATDINEDGMLDLYVANDYSTPDCMYINQGNGKFKDEIKTRTKQISFNGMGIDIADYNNDRSPEIAVVDMAIKDHFRSKTQMASMDAKVFNHLIKDRKYHNQYMFNSLQLNNQNGTFSNIANAVGLAKTDWSWSVLFSDFDQDHHKDLMITNGILRYPRNNDFGMAVDKAKKQNNGKIPKDQKQKLYDMMPSIPLVNQVYRNSGNLKLQDVSTDWGFADASFSSGCAYGDLDNDGDLDLIVNNINRAAFVYENTSNKNYLKVACKSADGKTMVNNVKVTVIYGDSSQVVEVFPTRGYFSSCEAKAFFGLDGLTQVDSLIVAWPDGLIEYKVNVSINQLLTVSKGQLTAYHKTKNHEKQKMFSSVSPASIGLDFVHQENVHNEYKKEILLPHSQATFGPFTAVGDINNDGLEDVFVGGAANQSGQVFIQNAEGKFTKIDNESLENHLAMEDLGAIFVDVNTDGFLDLYVVSGGGSEMVSKEELLQDRIYMNDGTGKLTYDSSRLPQMLTSGMRVKAVDYDKDGDMDLLVGGRTTPGAYPITPTTYLLNNTNGYFKDVTATVAPGLSQLGMVTDFEWCDFNNDQQMDVVLCGEWMSVKVFTQNNGIFTDHTNHYKLNDTKGWFYSLAVHDLNNDGQLDIIAGNVGLNNKYGPSDEKPMHIFMNDFDNNGTGDIVLSKKYKKSLVPVRGRQCSSQQMPFITSKFKSYAAFAGATLNEIYSEEMLRQSVHLEANTFASLAFISTDSVGFETVELPLEAQFSCVNDILVINVDDDSQMEFVCVGNQFNTEAETPRYDAGNGFVLDFDGTDFHVLNNSTTGLFVPKNSKSVNQVIINNLPHLIVGNNNDQIQVFIDLNTKTCLNSDDGTQSALGFN